MINILTLLTPYVETAWFVSINTCIQIIITNIWKNLLHPYNTWFTEYHHICLVLFFFNQEMALVQHYKLFKFTALAVMKINFFFHSDTSVMNHARHIMHYVHSSGLWWYRHPLSNNVHCNLQCQIIFCFLKFLKQAWDL